MKNKLTKILENSHSPYSNVKVSAIVIGETGKEYNGVNVENAAYPSSMCAERSAIYNAISNGEKAGQIKELHIYSNTNSVLYPCGGCLQVINEVLANDAKIVLYGPEESIVTNIKKLMPHGIKKESFGWK